MVALLPLNVNTLNKLPKNKAMRPGANSQLAQVPPGRVRPMALPYAQATTDESALPFSNTDRSRSSVFQKRHPLRNKTPNPNGVQPGRRLGGRSKASLSKINNNTFVFLAS
jgi:hypothetical protein